MTTHTPWSLEGTYIEACSCDAGCPCKFGAAPTRVSCTGVIGFEIEKGHCNEVDLSGLHLVLIMAAPASPYLGDITVTFYIEERATSQQRQALETILSGEVGGFFSAFGSLVGDHRGFKFAPVSMDTDGRRRTLEIPGIVDVVNEPLVDPLSGEEQEVFVKHSFDPFCPSGRAGRSPNAVCSDPDISFDVSGQQGYTGGFAWSGP